MCIESPKKPHTEPVKKPVYRTLKDSLLKNIERSACIKLFQQSPCVKPQKGPSACEVLPGICREIRRMPSQMLGGSCNSLNPRSPRLQKQFRNLLYIIGGSFLWLEVCSLIISNGLRVFGRCLEMQISVTLCIELHPCKAWDVSLMFQTPHYSRSLLFARRYV